MMNHSQYMLFFVVVVRGGSVVFWNKTIIELLIYLHSKTLQCIFCLISQEFHPLLPSSDQ